MFTLWYMYDVLSSTPIKLRNFHFEKYEELQTQAISIIHGGKRARSQFWGRYASKRLFKKLIEQTENFDPNFWRVIIHSYLFNKKVDMSKTIQNKKAHKCKTCSK